MITIAEQRAIYFHSFHEIYDLELFLFFSLILLNFVGFFEVSNRETLCRWFKLGTSRCAWTPGCYTNYFDFFLYFFLVCRLIPSVPLVNNLRSDIIEIWLEHSGLEPVGAGFSYVPIIPYRSFAKLSRQLDRGAF